MLSRLLIPLYLCLLPFANQSEEGYTIQIPRDIEISENGTISVNIIENHLSANEELNIVFEDNFTLSDSHGKANISGTMNENKITFIADDHESKTVSYNVEEIPVGEWQGNMDISISLIRHLPSNVLLSGPQLNAIFKRIRPNVIRFSHQPVSTDPECDVSLAQDGSILLYIVSPEEVLISNSRDIPITANENMAETFKEVDSLLNIEGLDLIDFSPCKDLSLFCADDIYLQEIDGISDIDTANITDMSFAFKEDRSLTTLDLSGWQTGSLLNLKGMFNNCSSLKELDFTSWTTGNVIDMSYLFAGCSELSDVDVSHFSTAAAEDLSYLFYGCDQLQSLDLTDWQTDNCRYLFNAFSGCRSLTTLGDLSNWNTEKIEGFERLFDGCSCLSSTGSLENWDTSAVTNMSMMFRNCSALTTLGDISGWNVENVESFANMFEGDRKLRNFGDLGLWNVSLSCQDLSAMFKDSFEILPAELDLSGWEVDNVTDMSMMFRNCFSLTSLNISGWNSEKLFDASAMFECNDSSKTSRLATISGIENLDTSSLENISRIFYDNRNLSADLSSWNTPALKDISYSFYGCWNFPIAYLENWDISVLENMNEAFGNNSGRRARSDPPSWYY